jgi:hypothetical protein
LFFSFLGNYGGSSSVSGNNGVYGTLGNSLSSSSSSLSSVYQPNQGSSSYNPTGLNQQAPYPHSTYPNHLQSSYGLPSSQSTGNVYGSRYASSSTMIPRNDIQSSTSPWYQYAPVNLSNGQNQTNYDPNMYYDPYYPHLPAQQDHSQQQPTAAVAASVINQSQTQIPIDQTIPPNGCTTSSNGGSS